MGLAEKAREVLVCQRVAEEINFVEGTDYRAWPSKSEPYDALLLSDSGGHATRQAQVVSTPQDFTIRYDNKNTRRFERTLRLDLERLGVSHCQITVNWKESAVRHGTENRLIMRLAEIIAAELPTDGYFCMRGVDLYDHSPEISEIVNYASMYRFQGTTLAVHSTCSWRSPRDGRWIEDALAKKLQRYGARVA
jgi:hypothetical protein